MHECILSTCTFAKSFNCVVRLSFVTGLKKNILMKMLKCKKININDIEFEKGGDSLITVNYWSTSVAIAGIKI